MSTTNSTTNYHLSQYVGSDVTSYLTNYNSDMSAIDAQMKINADAASTANVNASSAITTANAAASDASTALTTANSASTTATSAQTAAQEAQTAAGAAQTDAAAALTASAANNIANLAPAYDPTLTYDLGDLVTYVDPETNRGALYKNIVAIATPEAFNVNKWDDVTTSEVYRKKPKILSTVTAQSNETWKDALERLYAGITAEAENLELVRVNPSGLHTKYIFTDYIANTSLTFDKVSFDGTSVVLQEIHLQTNYCSFHLGVNNVYSDASTDTIAEGTILTVSEL